MPTTSHKSQRERPSASSPHGVPSRPEKAAGAGEEPLAALSRVIAALHPNSELILEQKKQLEELNSRLEVALNNMGRGLSMFDAQARLIVCNKLYREIYRLPEELTRPGTTLTEIVRYHVKMETGHDDPKDVEKQRKWIENHVAELTRGKSFSHTQAPQERPHRPGQQPTSRRRRMGRYSRGHHRKAPRRTENRLAGAS